MEQGILKNFKDEILYLKKYSHLFLYSTNSNSYEWLQKEIDTKRK